MASCVGAEAAPRVQVEFELATDPSTEIHNDLGHRIQLTSARFAVADFRFAQLEAGVERYGAGALDGAPVEADYLLHPGHADGTGVTGELSGRFEFDVIADAGMSLGTATMVVGDYAGASWTVDRLGGETDSEPAAGESGPAIELHGVARDASGVDTVFEVRASADVGRLLSDAVFEASIDTAVPGRVAFRFEPLDPYERDTVFDGVNFSELDTDGDGHVQLHAALDDEAALEAYYNVARRLLSHDHYILTHRADTEAKLR